jgi:hypothetical protein
MEEDLDTFHKSLMARWKLDGSTRIKQKTKPQKQWENLANEDGDEL